MYILKPAIKYFRKLMCLKSKIWMRSSQQQKMIRVTTQLKWSVLDKFFLFPFCILWSSGKRVYLFLFLTTSDFAFFAAD